LPQAQGKRRAASSALDTFLAPYRSTLG